MITEQAVRMHALDWTAADPVVEAFVHDPTFVTGNFGPLGSGKTASGVIKAWSYAQAWPGANIAVIRTTWPRLRDTTMKEVWEWCPDGVAGNYEATPKTFHLHTGAVAYGPRTEVTSPPSHLMFRALDDQADIENVLSLSLAAAWMDEPQGGLAPISKTLHNEPGMDHNLFLQLLSRLGRQSGYRRMCWLTGNPPDPSHWIAKEFQYNGHGVPANPRKNFHLYLSTQDTNRANLYHSYVQHDGACAVCGRLKVPDERRWSAIHQQGDYYRDLEDIYGVGTPLAQRFILGKWIPFRSLKPFDMDRIQYVSEIPEAERPTMATCTNVLAIDPAITKKDEGCRSSLTIAGAPHLPLYQDKRIVWRNLSGHWSPYELCGKILDWVRQYPLRKIRIEEVAWQSALKDIVQREAALGGVRLPYVELSPPRGDKLMRAMAWSGPVESGAILFDPSCVDLLHCMADIPENRMAWDPIDATGLALDGFAIRKAPQCTLPMDDAVGAKRAASYGAPHLIGSESRTPPRPTGSLSRPRLLKQRSRGYAVRAGT